MGSMRPRPAKGRGWGSSAYEGGGGYMLDRFLLPRVEQYGYNHSLRDVDTVVDYLRRNYKEYERKQNLPFRKMVERAVQIAKRRMSQEEQEEKRLLQQEQHHVSSRRKGGIPVAVRESHGGTVEVSYEDDDDDEDDEDDDDDDDVDEDDDGSKESLSAEIFRDGGRGRSVKSRRRRHAEDSDDDDDEEEDLAFDMMEEERGHNMLNASLRAAYGATDGATDSGGNRRSGGLSGTPSRSGHKNLREREMPPASTGRLAHNLAENDRATVPRRSQAARWKPLVPSPIPPSGEIIGAMMNSASPKSLSQSAAAGDGGDVQERVMAEGGHRIDTGGAGRVRENRKAMADEGILKKDGVRRQSRLDKGSASRICQGVGVDDGGGGGGRTPVSGVGPSSTGPVVPAPSPIPAPAYTRVTDLPETTKDKDKDKQQEIAKEKQTDGRKSGAQRERERPALPNQTPIKRGRTSQAAGGIGHGGGFVAMTAGGGGGGGGGDRSASALTVPKMVRFKDFGGIEGTLKAIRELIEYPLRHPEIYDWLGVEPPRGVLLHGPPGCGKTMLANAIAVEMEVPFLRISAPEIVSGMSGESEAKVRSLFSDAVRLAPCMVFIDEIDAITPKRETAQREMERRIVAQLLTCMDDLNSPVSAEEPSGAEEDGVDDGAGRNDNGNGQEGGGGQRRTRTRKGGHVVVVGATNRPDALDPALRRAGRFDREIALGIPDEEARARILEVLAVRLRLEGRFDFKKIARKTPGFVGADLAALSKEAAAISVNRIFSTLDRFSSTAAKTTDVSQAENRRGAGNPLAAVLSNQGGSTVSGESLQRRLCMKGSEGGGEDMEVEFTVSVGDAGGAAQARQEGIAMGGVQSLANGSLSEDRDGGKSVPRREAEGAEDEVMGEEEEWKRPLTRDELQLLSITMSDFEEAIPKVQPSATREGFSTRPDVTWDDVGSLDDVREELEFAISRPINEPEEFEAMGLQLSTGVLLYGPPGCGKTLVAKAIANDAGANFISIKGPELLNKYVGESERAVRQLFSRARSSSPCVLFFDEMDAMAPRRGSEGNAAAERVVNQLLTEIDGLDQRKGVYLIAATNRPDMIDPAMLRPGRLDKLLYVPLPEADGRVSILKTLTRRTPLSPEVDLRTIAENLHCTGFSGADLAALVREACIAALRERRLERGRGGVETVTEGSKHGKDADVVKQPPPPPPLVCNRHFSIAYMRVLPSVAPRDRKHYEELRQKLRRVRGSIGGGTLRGGNVGEGDVDQPQGSVPIRAEPSLPHEQDAIGS